MLPTESPWLTMAALLTLAVAFGVSGLSRSSKTQLLIAGVCVALSVGVIVFERYVVTDREIVEENVIGVVRAFESGDVERTQSFFSAGAACERLLVAAAMNIVTVDQPLAIKAVNVRLQNENSVAISEFRVNGTVNVRGRNVGHQPSMWRITWRREAGEWKIVRIEELDPIREDRIDRLDRLGVNLCP